MFRAFRNCLGPVVLAGLAIGGCQTQHYVGKEPRESSVEHAEPPAPAPRPLPQGTAEGVPEHLLHEYEKRDPATEAEIRTWQLPFQAKRIAVALLTLAARDDMSRMSSLFTRHARWGFPDRREFEARPVFADDDGRVFFDTFREVASRFARKEAFFCPPIVPPAAQLYVRNGAEPQWCAYLSKDGVDVLAFKFVYENGSAKIDYVGMAPSRNIRPRKGGPAQPPMTPQIKRGTSPTTPMVQLEQSGGGSNPTLEIKRRDLPLPADLVPVPPAGSAPAPDR